MIDSRKLILKGFIYTTIGLVFSKIFTYGWRVIVARVGAEEYGMLSLVLAIFQFLVPISALGLSFAVERYVSFYVGKDDRVGAKSTIVNSLRVSFASSIIFAFILYFSSEFIAISVFSEPEMVPILKIFSVFLPILVLSRLLTPMFRIYNRLDLSTGIKSILEPSLKLLLSILLIYLGYGIFGVSFAYLFAIAASFVFMFYFSRKYCFDFLDKTIPIRNNLSELLHYSMPLIISGFAGFILMETDTLMLGYFKDMAQVGIYNVAYPTASLLLIIPSGLLVVFMAITTKYLAKNKLEEIRDTYRFVTKWIFVLNFFIYMVMFTYSDKLILFLFGEEYILAGPVLKILVTGIFLKSLLGTSAFSILNMFKKTKTTMSVVIITAILNIILNYNLIPLYGMIGAAASTLVSMLIYISLLQYFTLKQINIVPFSKDMVLSAVCSIILFYGVIKILHIIFGSISIYWGLVIIPMIGIIYIAILYLFKIITIGEFNTFLDLVKRKYVS